MLKGIEANLARDMLAALPVQTAVEVVPLAEAWNRVAADEIRAAVPIPPFDRSPYDGYAFRGEDTAQATPDNPAVLEIIEEIPAGKQPERRILPGTAAKILTGAPIPSGANTTIKFEKTSFTAAAVRIYEPVRPDSDIVYAGEDLAAGARVIAAGALVTAPVLGLLASQGLVSLPVFCRPKVAILSSGSELAEPGRPLSPAKIYNSSYYAISGYLRDFGAVPADAGVVDDDPAAIAVRILRALDGADMLITTGGASVGDYDCMITVLETLGADILFWKTAMKPGGSILAATLSGKLILGLSGNPGAALLGLLRIALPSLRKLCGRSDLWLPEVEVILKYPLTKKSPQLRILRGRLDLEGGTAWFVENQGQGNGIVSSFVGCDLLGEIPAGSPPLPAGTRIKAYRLQE